MPSRITTAVVAVLLAASGVHAQVLPGASMDSPIEVRAQFMRTVLAAVDEPLERWIQAWSEGDVGTVADSYVEEAYLVAPDGTTLAGREVIREHLGEHPEGMGPLEVFFQDADASHRMAMVVSRYQLEARGGGPAGTVQAGSVLTIWVQEGRRWRIRAQIFQPGS